MELRSVVGYEGRYSVTDDGRVFSHKNNKWLKLIMHSQGYLTVHLSTPEIGSRNKRVHRLVAESFIPNPEKFPQISHKNLNKSNNNVSNLEWVTSRTNSIRALERRKKMVLLSKTDKKIAYLLRTIDNFNKKNREKFPYLRYETKKEYHKARARKFYKKNKKRILEKNKERRVNDPSYRDRVRKNQKNYMARKKVGIRWSSL